MSSTSEALRVLASVRALLDSLEKDLRDRDKEEGPEVHARQSKQKKNSQTQTCNSDDDGVRATSSEPSAGIGEELLTEVLGPTVERKEGRESCKSICCEMAVESLVDEETEERKQAPEDFVQLRKRSCKGRDQKREGSEPRTPSSIRRSASARTKMQRSTSGRGLWAEQEVQNLKSGVRMMSKLMKIAEEFNVAVLITNQVMSNPDGAMTFVSDPKKPVGGHVIAHASTTRLEMKKGRGDCRSPAGRWAGILALYDFKPGRTTVNLKDKWRNLQLQQKKEQAESAKSATATLFEHGEEQASLASEAEKDTSHENKKKPVKKQGQCFAGGTGVILEGVALVGGCSSGSDENNATEDDRSELLSSLTNDLANEETDSEDAVEKQDGVVRARGQTSPNPSPEPEGQDNSLAAECDENELYALSRSTALSPPSSCSPATQVNDSGKEMTSPAVRDIVKAVAVRQAACESPGNSQHASNGQGFQGSSELSRKVSPTGKIKIDFRAAV